MSRIEVKGLSFGYSDGRKVLEDISFTLEGTGLYCIIGPNGVGKSTLVKCIDGLLTPTSGKVMVDGRDVHSCSIRERSGMMTFVPVVSSTAFPMSVLDSILIGRESRNRISYSDEDLESAFRALRVMNMRDLALCTCDELSAGQMQKVAICRGLVRQTPIMMLDEPTANLDIKHQVFLAEFFQKLAHATGSLILMISHDINLAARYADRIIVLKEPGVLYAVGKPSEVINRDTIREVYSVDSDIIEVEGKPYVVLRRTLSW
ncbi:MAG: ABC transporter ATP-binding protein [archaeon]|nr:ABC transporter ATP-binding protein [archaeon]